MEIGDEMKILVTGVGGQLGYDVIRELTGRQIDCIGADLKEFDITDYEAAHNGRYIFYTSKCIFMKKHLKHA